MATRVRFVDIYSVYDDIDLNIIENLLGDYNIACTIKEFESESYDEFENAGEKVIAVEEDKLDRARLIIRDALKNGVISKEGRFEA